MAHKRPPRITLTYLWHEFLGAFNWDKGFMYTVKALAIRPGAAIRDYLREDRSRYFNPIRFLVLTVAVSTLLMTEFEVFEQSLPPFAEAKTAKSEAFLRVLSTAFTRYLNALQLITVPLFALFSWLFFRRQGYNYAEHLTMNAYVTGESSLLYILLMPVVYYSVSVYFFLSVAVIVYYVWAYTSFFGSKRRVTFFKSVTATALSFIIFVLLVITIAVTYVALSTEN